MKTIKANTKTIYLKIAGFNIKIKFHKAQSPHREKIFKQIVTTHFKGFITQKKKKQPDYCINFVEQNHFEILRKGDKKKHFLNIVEYLPNNSVTSYYHVSISQLQFILRNTIQNLLTQNNGFILHGSACVINDTAYLFTGSSGAGKSTVIKLLKNTYLSLADDSVIIRKIGNTFYLYQTPFTEKEWWVEKGLKKYPLKKVYFLCQADVFLVSPIESKEKVLKIILSQFWANDKTYVKKQMRFVLDFVSHFQRFYGLSFRKERTGLLKVLAEK